MKVLTLLLQKLFSSGYRYGIRNSGLVSAKEKLTVSEVIDTFLQAARTSGLGQEIDPHVQEALGALYYMEGNYDRSVDCFEAALTVKPNVNHSISCNVVSH